MWMSKTGRTFVGLIALAAMMLTVAPTSAGARPPKDEPPEEAQTVFLTMTVEAESGGDVLRTTGQCGGPLTMVQETPKRLRVDWIDSDVPGVPGMEFEGWGLTGCHGATDVPEGMVGGFLTLNETSRGLELTSRFDYQWINCTMGKGKTGCENVRLRELSVFVPGLELSDLSDGIQWTGGELELRHFDKAIGGWTPREPVPVVVNGSFQLATP